MPKEFEKLKAKLGVKSAAKIFNSRADVQSGRRRPIGRGNNHGQLVRNNPPPRKKRRNA